MVKFDTTRREARIITQIADRAMGLSLARLNDPFTHCDVMMDVSAVHCNGCRLRLDSLLAADAFNFAHDILGIRTHLDRATGKLTDCFLPRFADMAVAA